MEDNNNKLNQEDKNVEQAIDNIFDEKDNKKNEEELSKTSLNININDDNFDYSKIQDEIQIDNFENDNSKESSTSKLNEDNSDKKDDRFLNFVNNDFNNENVTEDNKLINDNNQDEDNLVYNNEVDNTYSVPVEAEKEHLDNNKKLLYLIIGAIVIAILIIVLCIININCEKKTNCSYTFEDKNFKITDNYEIKYKKDKIIYVNGNYNYVAKTKEYQNQINNIRLEKIPAMVNSNAMKGFTYILNEENDAFQMKSSLDFTSFDYDEISKVDQKTKPISYFEIDSNLTYKKLKDILKKQGYSCKRA